MNSSMGFMEKVYRGVLDEAAFRSYQAPRDTEKVHSLLGKYEELLKAYPPRVIEAEGRIPGEMLRRMAEEGFFGISIPEDYGGSGVSLLDFLRMVEEISSAD